MRTILALATIVVAGLAPVFAGDKDTARDKPPTPKLESLTTEQVVAKMNELGRAGKPFIVVLCDSRVATASVIQRRQERLRGIEESDLMKKGFAFLKADLRFAGMEEKIYNKMMGEEADDLLPHVNKSGVILVGFDGKSKGYPHPISDGIFVKTQVDVYVVTMLETAKKTAVAIRSQQ